MLDLLMTNFLGKIIPGPYFRVWMVLEIPAVLKIASEQIGTNKLLTLKEVNINMK